MAANLDHLNRGLEDLEARGLRMHFRVLEGPQGAWLTIEGRQVLNLCSNNYLDLASHPRLKEAARAAVEKYGVGPGAVRTIAGTLDLHEQLEERLAAFKQVESVVVLQSGFNANQAVIPAVTGPEDVILSDELNHASIIDGVRLSRAQRRVWAHRDIDDLRARLTEPEVREARSRLIITDGVFSMDGDIAPLADIIRTAEEHDALVMVDDAHGEGVLGDHGRGIVDHFGMHGRCPIEVGTLSKAFGVLGGFVAGSKTLTDYVKQQGRPFLFSTGLSPADTAAAIAAVELLEGDDSPVRRLWSNTAYFKQGMLDLGFDTGETQTPIIPVMLYEAETAQAFARALFERGFFAMAIGFPVVPRGKARIRVMMTAAHSTDDLDRALEAFGAVGRELGVLG
jgi:glycine C-acetyltransferase